MINISDYFVQFSQFSLTVPSLPLKDKGLVLLSGTNGSGKSTLLRSILNLHHNYQGLITLHDKDVKTLSRQEIAQEISYLPQVSMRLPEITGEDFIKQGLYLKGEDQYESLIDYLGISHLLVKNCQTMSGGEKQLVGFVRSLALKRKIIVLDEPESFLAKSNRQKIVALISSLAKDHLILLSSHHGDLYDPHINLYFDETEDYSFQITTP